MADVVLDTSVLLSGREPPPGRRLLTTPEADAEVSPGGRSAARFARWKARGLTIRSPRPEAVQRVREAARRAGNLERLSAADQSLVALALELEAPLWTDDHTILDVCRRLGVDGQPVETAGIRTTLDWRLRCAGCGRWFDAVPGPDCPVCGSEVRRRPVKGRRG